MPELREIGLDPAVQGVPVKKKQSVLNQGNHGNQGTITASYLTSCQITLRLVVVNVVLLVYLIP